MRLLALVVAIACAAVACTSVQEGTAVSKAQPPQDVWQLADQVSGLVPLTVEKMEDLLGTPMVRDTQNPRRWEGGAVQLAPSLKVSSSVIGIDDGTWMFASISIEAQPCVSLDMVKSHYPALKQVSAPTGHSLHEVAVWATAKDWGDLRFSIREKEKCLTGISLEPPS
jgi:hypothetical protein